MMVHIKNISMIKAGSKRKEKNQVERKHAYCHDKYLTIDMIIYISQRN